MILYFRQAKLLRALQLDPQHVCSLYNYGRLLDYVWDNPDKVLTLNPTP